MKALRITKPLLESIALAAQRTYPLEFIAFLGSKKNNGIADEIVVVPAVMGEEHAMLYTSMLPFDKSIMGSVHSHPSRHNFPSKADLASFRKLGKAHLIISYPYSIHDFAAYNNNGERISIEIID